MAFRIPCLLLHLSSAQVVYHHVANGGTYWSCRSRCADEGHRLPCIRNSSEDAALYVVAQTVSPGPSFIWIGYTDVGTEGRWEWEPGCDSSYTNWTQNQPDNGYGGTEHCGTMGVTWKWGPGQWNDLHCENLNARYTVACVCEALSAAGWFCNGTGCFPCGAGTFSTERGSSSCTACGAGTFAAEPGSSSCTACPAGYNSGLGQPSCLPEPRTVLATIATPNLTVSGDSSEQVQLLVEVAPLPPAAKVYGNITLLYNASLRSSNGSVGGLLACRLQQQSATLLASSLSPKQLQEDCAWEVGAGNDTVHVAGVVMVTAGERDGVLEASFPFSVHLDFPNFVYGSRSFTTIVWPDLIFRMTAFGSTLSFYKTVQYIAVKPDLLFLQGEAVFVEHSLKDSASLFYLKEQQVWLATSFDPADVKAMKVNLTGTLSDQSLQMAPGRARFSFQAPECNVCVLHVLSVLTAVSSDGRRLSTVSHAHAAVSWTMQQSVDGAPIVAPFVMTMVVLLLPRLAWEI